MQKWCCGVLFGFSLLLHTAQAAEDAVTEEGWLYSKQAPHYSDFNQSEFPADRLEASATLRSMWIDTRYADTKQTATAFGGHFAIETAEFYGLSGLIGVQTSQKLWGINPGNAETVHPEFYDAEGEAFTYLSEAELRYTLGDFSFRAGRMNVQTPYADPDDIRMAYNTFEGVAAGYTLNDALHFELFYFNRWAGFDSSEAQSEFVRFGERSEGMAAAGAVYTTGDTLETSLWAYYADRLFALLYAEAVGNIALMPEVSLEWGVQAAQMRERDASGIKGEVLGAMGTLHYRHLYGGFAYNRAMPGTNGVVTDGFGGGPYFTSLDEATIAAVSELFPGHDLSVYRIGGGFELVWGLPENAVYLEAVYGVFDPEKNTASIAETDLLLWSELTPSLRIDAVFASFDARRCAHPDCRDFERYWIRLDYTF
ncbi:MAG: OprD family outer membrane porin [Campylobacterales bacterium]|jgi:hypothetical protein